MPSLGKSNGTITNALGKYALGSEEKGKIECLPRFLVSDWTEIGSRRGSEEKDKGCGLRDIAGLTKTD